MIQINFSRVLIAFFVSCFILIPAAIIMQENHVPETIAYIVFALYIACIIKWITTPPYIPDAKIDTLRATTKAVTQQLERLSRTPQNGEGDLIAQTIAALIIVTDSEYRNMQKEEYTAPEQAVKKLHKDTRKCLKRNTQLINKICKHPTVSPATSAALALVIYGAYPGNENQATVEDAAGFLEALSLTMAEQLLQDPVDQRSVELLETVVINLGAFNHYLENANEEIRLNVKQETEDTIRHICQQIHALSDELYEQYPRLRPYTEDLLNCCHNITQDYAMVAAK